VSVHEPHAEDDLVRGILGVVSQAERRRMGAFLSSSFRERARRGLPHGKTPFGFRKSVDGHLEPDPEMGPWALQVVERLEAGWSLWKVSVWLNAHHVADRKWEPNVVRNMARAPAIAGGVKCGDVLTWDAHEPIIDRDRWDRLQRILDTRIRSRQKTDPSWLEGLVFCGCGAPMYLITDRHNFATPKRQFRCAAGPSVQDFQRTRGVGRCDFQPRSIMLHAAVDGTIDALTADLSRLLDADEAIAQARERFASTDSTTGKERTRLDRELAKANDERERLLVLYRRGTLDVDRWEESDRDVADRIESITGQIAHLPVPPDPAAIRAARNELATIAGTLHEAIAVDATQVRTLLLTIGAHVQRTTDGVRIVWPADLAPLIGDGV
jgi:hypothetical protein